MHVLEIIERVAAALSEQDADAGSRFARQARATVLDIELEAARRVLAYDGVSELLQRLRARGMVVGIVTRNGRRPVERILERISLAHDVLLTRDDVAHVKPDPRHLLDALDQVGVPSRLALMVGDHPMDIVAGQRAGMLTAAVISDGGSKAAFGDVAPDLFLQTVTELWDHLFG